MCPPQIHEFTGIRPLGQTHRSAPTITGIVSQTFCKMKSQQYRGELVTKGVTGALVLDVEEREVQRRQRG